MSKQSRIEPLEEIIAKLKQEAEQQQQQGPPPKDDRDNLKRPAQQKLAITDMQILKKHHKFLRDDDNDNPNYRPNQYEYGQRLARKYYTKLYKEYAIVDLEFYELGKQEGCQYRIGCRWRTEKEVIASKGENICGNKRCQNPGRETYQFNFAYQEEGIKKNALVKVRLCMECVPRLNYRKAHVKIEE